MREQRQDGLNQDPWATWKPAIRMVLVAVVIVLGLWLLFVLQVIVVQLLFALILATGLDPLVDRLQGWRLSRGLSVTLIYGACALALVVLGLIVIPPIVSQIQDAVQNAPRYTDLLRQRLNSLPLGQQLGSLLQGAGGQVGNGGVQVLGVLGVGAGILGVVGAFGFILIVALFLTVDGEQMQEYLLSYLHFNRRAQARILTDRMARRMGDWFRGQVLISVVAGVLTFIVLLVLRVPDALLFGFLAALGQAIPLIGPVLAAIPAIIVATFQSPVQGIATLVFYFLLMQFENAILMPKIIGEAVKLHPLVILLALTIGTVLLGPVGAIVALPAASALAVVLEEVRRESTPAVVQTE